MAPGFFWGASGAEEGGSCLVVCCCVLGVRGFCWVLVGVLFGWVFFLLVLHLMGWLVSF